MNADVPLEQDGYGLVDIVDILRSRLRLLISVPLAAGLLSAMVAFLLTPIYAARTTFLPPQQQQSSAAAALSSLGALAGLAGVGGIKSPADQYVSLLQSSTVTNALIDQFELVQVYDAKYRVDAQRALLTNSDIQLGRRDGLITVVVEDTDPKRAADIANAYVEELRKLTGSLSLSEAQERRVFFEKQLQATHANLSDAQRALQSSGFSEGALRAEPKAAAESYAKIRAEITAAEVRINGLRASLVAGAPELRQAESGLATLRAELAKLERENAGSANGDYVSKYRNFKYQEALFELFARQYELARIDEAREGALVQVIDRATPPEKRARPVRVLIVGATIAVSSVLTALFILFRHFWANARTLRTNRRFA